MTNAERRDDVEKITIPYSGERPSLVGSVAQITSKKWHREILNQLTIHGSLRFNELKRELDGISDKVLSESLSEMEDNGLVHRTVKDTKPVQVEYSLTNAGSALESVLDAVKGWAETYIEQVKKEP